IVDHGGQCSVRELQRGPRRYQNNPELAEFDLAALVDAGYGSWEHRGPSPKGGQPTTVFILAESPDFNIQKVMTDDGTQHLDQNSEVVSSIDNGFVGNDGDSVNASEDGKENDRTYENSTNLGVVSSVITSSAFNSFWTAYPEKGRG